MNGIGFILTLIASLMVFIGSRRWAILGVFVAVCYITQGQLLDIGGFHFTSIRLVLLFAVARSLMRGEFREVKFNSLDWILIIYAIFSAWMASWRTGFWQEPVGTAYNVLFSYFAFRCLVWDWQDAEQLATDLAFFIVPLALFMVVESATGVNVFNVMGGQEADTLREGRVRCIGSFRGPHTAGTFGASLLPLFAGLYFLGKRGAAITGALAATAITLTSNSSGPLLAYLSSLVGLAFWTQRYNMRRVRRILVASLIVLACVMKAPIWYLMAKISAITGGDGWYRSYLMDQCWQHMRDWWLMGTNDTSDWAVTTMSYGQADLCNVYVACAASGGMGALVLFILLLVKGFQKLGHALEIARESFSQGEIIFWCLGACLFSHVMTLFSVTYWDQMHVPWWGMLAIIAGVASREMATVVSESADEATLDPNAPPEPGLA